MSVHRTPNAGQCKAVESDKSASMFIIAGPGTGKTATLTMRMLKLVFVDGVSPRGILATTFREEKASSSSVCELGLCGPGVSADQRKTQRDMDKLWLERIDINQVRTGTIDGVCKSYFAIFAIPVPTRQSWPTSSSPKRYFSDKVSVKRRHGPRHVSVQRSQAAGSAGTSERRITLCVRCGIAVIMIRSTRRLAKSGRPPGGQAGAQASQ